jgi:hypothetical protein
VIDRGCSTADCAGLPLRMVRLNDLPGEGPWPYCVECAEVLSRGGDEDCGPFDPVTDEMVERGAVALCVAMTGDPSLVDPDDRYHARAVLAAALGDHGTPAESQVCSSCGELLTATEITAGGEGLTPVLLCTNDDCPPREGIAASGDKESL